MSTATKPTPIPERLALLDEIELKASSHPPPPEKCDHPEGCDREIASWVLGQEWSDRAPWESPVLAAFRRRLNDGLPTDLRQKLKATMFDGIGTAGDGRDEDRAWMITDWSIRVALPTWLELAGVEETPKTLSKQMDRRGSSRPARDTRRLVLMQVDGIPVGPCEAKQIRERRVNEHLSEIRRAVHDGEWAVALSEGEKLNAELRAIVISDGHPLPSSPTTALLEAAKTVLGAEFNGQRPGHTADEHFTLLFDAVAAFSATEADLA